MPHPIRRYRALSYEQKIIVKTIVGLFFSALLACAKLVIGVFTDYNLCTIAVYTFAILLAKLECVLGARAKDKKFQARNLAVAVFLFVSSLVYLGFMLRMLFSGRQPREYNLLYVGVVALISFAELGFAIAGILRTKNRGHFYRDIKIINFCISLMAILTTQITILDYTATADTGAYNAYTGMGVGGFIALCAVYIYFAPRISVIDREYNAFALADGRKNTLIDMRKSAVEIVLCRSTVYGSYVYRARIADGRVDGRIGRDPSLWKRMHVLVKILCCILSEILIFAWLAGRLVFLLRSADVAGRLETKMNRNGFVRLGEGEI